MSFEGLLYFALFWWKIVTFSGKVFWIMSHKGGEVGGSLRIK
jgi:hypothetical protein